MVVSIRGVQYVLNIMHKCIMVKVGVSQKNEKGTKRGGWKFIYLAEIGGICNIHHWLREWMPLVAMSYFQLFG